MAKEDVVNTGVHVLIPFLINVVFFFICLARSGTAGSYSRWVFTLLRNYRIVFQSDSAMVYFYQQCNESSSHSISLPMTDEVSL